MNPVINLFLFAMRSFTDKELLTRVSNLPSFTGFPVGPLDICVRSGKDEYDRFDDQIFTYEGFGGVKMPEFKMRAIGTTNAGSFGLLRFRTYNRAGCAVLKTDEIVIGSHAYGLHKGKPAYVQVKGFPYTRDNNRNQKSENYGQVFTDIIGANRHRAGKFSKIIYNWSVGCIVNREEAVFLRWLDVMRRRPLSVAILSEF